MEEKDKLIPPELSNKDFNYSLAKGIVSMIPGVGGAISTTIFEDILNSPIQKRMHEWRVLVQESILELQEENEQFSVENLRENPEFISLFLELQPIAIKNHQKKKLEFLRNFLLKSVIDKSDFDFNKKLLLIIEELSPYDILILYHLEVFKHLVRNSRKKKYKGFVKTRFLMSDRPNFINKYPQVPVASSDEYVDYLADVNIIDDSYTNCFESLENLENRKLIKKEYYPIDIHQHDEKVSWAGESDFVKVMCIETTELGHSLLRKIIIDFPKCLKEI